MKKSTDYSKTIMYKIVPKDLNSDLIYVGHTTNFKVRKSSHKLVCKTITNRSYNLKLYQMIRENGGWDEWQMIQIEEFCCQNKREAEKRERELMEEYNANLNKARPIITEEERVVSKKEYYKKNKDAITIRNNQYYEKNKDAINAKNREKRLQKRLDKPNSV